LRKSEKNTDQEQYPENNFGFLFLFFFNVFKGRSTVVKREQQHIMEIRTLFNQLI